MTKKTVLIVVLVILGILILATGSYAGYRYWKNKKEAEQQTADKESNNAPAETKSVGSTVDNTTVGEESTQNAGWSLYKNYLVKYKIEYPDDAKLTDLSDPAAANINDSKCLKISTDNYYVIIGTVPSESDPVTCFRTGVGSDWSSGPTETVSAAGMEYTITGMHTEAASVGYYRDFFSISPVDERVKIEYGIDINEKYGTITKVTAKDIVHKIVASYSPAE